MQAQRDTESSIISKFWMPVFTGMTTLMALFAITTQSHAPGLTPAQSPAKETVSQLISLSYRRKPVSSNFELVPDFRNLKVTRSGRRLDAGFHRHDDFNGTFCYYDTVSCTGSYSGPKTGECRGYPVTMNWFPPALPEGYLRRE